MPKSGNYTQFQALKLLLENKAPCHDDLQSDAHASKSVLLQNLHRRKAEGRGQRAEGKDKIIAFCHPVVALPTLDASEDRKICTEMACHEVQGVLIQSPGFIHKVILLPSAFCLLPSAF